MIRIDMWYGNKRKEADKIDVTFYPNDGEYRGNIYKEGIIIGDYTCNNSIELERNFPQLHFNGKCEWNCNFEGVAIVTPFTEGRK